MDTIQEIDPNQELKVTFYPELFLQRRIWILNILRKENITKVCQILIFFSGSSFIQKAYTSSQTPSYIGSRCGMR